MSRPPTNPTSIFSPGRTPDDGWRRLREPPSPPTRPGRGEPVEAVLIGVCAAIAVAAAAWSVWRDPPSVDDAPASTAIVAIVPLTNGQSLQDVCAAYGLPTNLCDLSERCAAQAPRRDGRVALILRSDGADCGQAPP